jgi:hypothetical protein
MGYDRRNAAALKAVDAKTLLKSALPVVFNILTPAQIEQVQKVLDAEVVNPEIYKKANEIYQKSAKYYGSLVVRDEQMVNKAYRLSATMIAVGEKDKHVRLDFNKLLTSDALLPVTDNPDEVHYLQAVRTTLNSKGIWLRFEHQLVRDPDDYGHWIIDPRTFKAWLSLGFDGGEIPTKDGRIDREALLGTTLLGAGYYEHVYNGPIERELKRQMEELNSAIDDVREEHNRLVMRKLDAPIVGGISDTLGGAHLPDEWVWEYPYKLLIKARELHVKGNISVCMPYLVVGAIITRNNANLLAEYVEASEKGAGRAIKILKVARTAGKVAEVGLAITGVGGLIRGGASVAGGTAVADASVDEAALKLMAQHAKRNPTIAADLNEAVEVVKMPKGTVLGKGVKAGQSSGAGTGWHKW